MVRLPRHRLLSHALHVQLEGRGYRVRGTAGDGGPDLTGRLDRPSPPPALTKRWTQLVPAEGRIPTILLNEEMPA
jgi:hypothetical protein